MSLTKEQKEIGVDVWLKMPKEPFIHQVINMFDEFLSRIREEQEADSYRSLDRKLFITPEDRCIWPDANMPLFTIPPAPQDNPKGIVSPLGECNELVEALEMFVWPYQERFNYTDYERADKAKEVLAKHKAMMGEK